MKNYEKTNKFGFFELLEIQKGRKRGLSEKKIAMYAKPYYDYHQMSEIRMALQYGFTPEKVRAIMVLNPEGTQMKEGRRALIEGLKLTDIEEIMATKKHWVDMNKMRMESSSRNPIEITSSQLDHVREIIGKDELLDRESMDYLQTLGFDYQQSTWIKHGINKLTNRQIMIYGKVDFDDNQMNLIYNAFEDDFNTGEIQTLAKSNIDSEQMEVVYKTIRNLGVTKGKVVAKKQYGKYIAEVMYAYLESNFSIEKVEKMAEEHLENTVKFEEHWDRIPVYVKPKIRIRENLEDTLLKEGHWLCFKNHEKTIVEYDYGFKEFDTEGRRISTDKRKYSKLHIYLPGVNVTILDNNGDQRYGIASDRILTSEELKQVELKFKEWRG